MVEIPQTESIGDLDSFSEQLIFDLEALESLSTEEKGEYIQKHIIPEMDERRDHKIPMSAAEVHDKLHRIPNK